MMTFNKSIPIVVRNFAFSLGKNFNGSTAQLKLAVTQSLIGTIPALLQQEVKLDLFEVLESVVSNLVVRLLFQRCLLDVKDQVMILRQIY